MLVPGEPILIAEYSDRLGEVLLKGRKPAYRERQQVELSGSVEAHISGTISLEDLRQLDQQTPDELEAWKQQRGFSGRGKGRLGA